MTPDLMDRIAHVCHEANRAICQASGDDSQRPWAQAEEWQRQSARDGVRFRVENPDATAADQHGAWCDAKVRDGWVWGPVKDAAAKTHPCLVPYGQLSVTQQSKDHVFAAIVRVMAQ